MIADIDFEKCFNGGTQTKQTIKQTKNRGWADLPFLQWTRQ